MLWTKEGQRESAAVLGGLIRLCCVEGWRGGFRAHAVGCVLKRCSGRGGRNVS